MFQTERKKGRVSYSAQWQLLCILPRKKGRSNPRLVHWSSPSQFLSILPFCVVAPLSFISHSTQPALLQDPFLVRVASCLSGCKFIPGVNWRHLMGIAEGCDGGITQPLPSITHTTHSLLWLGQSPQMWIPLKTKTKSHLHLIWECQKLTFNITTKPSGPASEPNGPKMFLPGLFSLMLCPRRKPWQLLWALVG